MKTLLSKLVVSLATLLPMALFAQTTPYMSRYYFTADLPVSYEYDKEAATSAAMVPSPLVKNEIFRVLLVRDTRSNVTKTTQPSVTIDAAGQIVLGENALGATWCWLNYNNTAVEYIPVGDSAAGVPKQELLSSPNSVWYGFDTYLRNTSDLPGTGGYVYRYLVVLDTRMGTGTCAGSATHVARYAMALSPDASKNSVSATSIPQVYDVYIPEPEDYDDSYTYINWPGYDLGWQSASAIESLVVTQNGAQVTLTGDALAAYLKPSVNSLTQGVEDGQSVLNLAVTAPDVQYYTLYTKAKLSDAEWTKFEDYVKTLDNVDGKYYTRFRIDGESPLKIPVLTDETSRFYQLRGE